MKKQNLLDLGYLLVAIFSGLLLAVVLFAFTIKLIF